MGYLLPAEYEAYGLTADTPDAWVTAASAMMEAFCKRSSLAATTYVERLRVGRRSHAVQLSYAPVISISALRTRFAYGRAAANDAFCAQAAAAFCAPGTWLRRGRFHARLRPDAG